MGGQPAFKLTTFLGNVGGLACRFPHVLGAMKRIQFNEQRNDYGASCPPRWERSRTAGHQNATWPETAFEIWHQSCDWGMAEQASAIFIKLLLIFHLLLKIFLKPNRRILQGKFQSLLHTMQFHSPILYLRKGQWNGWVWCPCSPRKLWLRGILSIFDGYN